MNRSARLSRSPAFTLVELLVVITIIAVLAGLIFPAVSAVLRKSYQTTSVSNLRQWYTAFAASLSNNNGEIPGAGASPINASDVDAWYNRMPPEIKERPFSQFIPATQPGYGKKSIWVNPAVPRKDWAVGGFVFNYGFNDQLVELRDPKGPQPLRISSVQSPALTILMGEKADPTPSLNAKNARTYFNTSDPVNDQTGKANFVFCDGHVDTITRAVFQDAKAANAAFIDTKEATVSWQPYGLSASKE